MVGKEGQKAQHPSEPSPARRCESETEAIDGGKPGMSLDEHDSAEKLNQLLAKLRELDLETHTRLWVLCGEVEVSGEYELSPPCYLWYWALQGVIQEAIVSRKWRIGAVLAYDEDDDVPGWVIDVWPSHKICRTGRAETPAEALLAAYIQALEAEAAR